MADIGNPLGILKTPITKKKSTSNKKLEIGRSLKSSAFSSNNFDIVKEAFELKFQSTLTYIIYNYQRRVKFEQEINPKDRSLENVQTILSALNPEDKTLTCVISNLKFPSKHFEFKQVITKFNLGDKQEISFELNKACNLFLEGLPTYMCYRTGNTYKMSIEAFEQLIKLNETLKIPIVEFPGIGVFGRDNLPKDLVAYKDYYKFDERISKSSVEDKERAYRFGLESPSFRITSGLTYTFGVEIECATSFVPPNTKSVFNMSCVRDGSLNGGKGGPEYVTGVLTGDSGVLHLQKIVNYLASRSTIDKYCGIHVHIGGFLPSKEFSVAIFLLCYYLQTDIFFTLPITRRNNEYCRLIPDKIIKKMLKEAPNTSSKVKDTSKFIVNDLYDILVEYIGALDLLGGKESFLNSKGRDKNEPLGKFLNKNCNHPMGKKANYNHQTPRYEWLNLVPLLFNEKGKDVFTVEFRPHPASLNFIKIKNWLLLCMFITKYAEVYANRIISNFLTGKMTAITIDNILSEVCPLKIEAASLSKYFNDRKSKFNNSKDLLKEETVEYDEESLKVTKDLKIKELCV